MSKIGAGTQTLVTTPAQALVAIGTVLATQGQVAEGVVCILVGAALTFGKLKVKEAK